MSGEVSGRALAWAGKLCGVAPGDLQERGFQIYQEAFANFEAEIRAEANPGADALVGRLREMLLVVADGEEPRPVGKTWFPDGRPSKHDQCTHGIWMYETCGNCIMEYAQTALSAIDEGRGGKDGD